MQSKRQLRQPPSGSPHDQMTKILSLLIVAMMVLHIIRPLGLPGLRERRDFWKLAVVALLAIALTAVLSHGN